MHIIDAHCHVPSTRFLPQALIESSVDNIIAALAASGVPHRRTALIDSCLARLQDHQCDAFLAEMDHAGVAEAVLLLPDFTHVLPGGALDMSEAIRQHAAILARHPGRFHYFCGVDPRGGAAAVDLFESAVRDHGCTGLKLYPPCGYSPSDPSLHPFYEICHAWGLPVLLHTGPTAPLLEFGPADPNLVDEAARRFPEVAFILAHGGVNHVEATCLMAAYRPNVFLDFSGYAASIDPAGSVGALRALLARRLNHKVIFGTDWPIFMLRGPYRDLVASVTAEDGPIADLSEAEARLVMAGNIRRLLPARA